MIRWMRLVSSSWIEEWPRSREFDPAFETGMGAMFASGAPLYFDETRRGVFEDCRRYNFRALTVFTIDADQPLGQDSNQR